MRYQDLKKELKRPQIGNITVPRAIISSVLPPIEQSVTPLVWRVRQYVKNDSTAYEPVLSDFTTLLPDGIEIYEPDHVHDYLLPTYNGHLVDDYYEQYHHKIYSVRLFADRSVSIPLAFLWSKQIVVVKVHDDTETVIYTTELEDNKRQRILVELEYGITDVHIMTYTATTGQRLALALDIAAIHATIRFAERLTTRFDYGKVIVNNVTNSTYNDVDRVSVDVPYDIRDGQAIPYCAYLGGSYGGVTCGGDARIQRDGSGYVVPYDDETKFGCWVQYRNVVGGSMTLYIAYEVEGYA